MANTEPSEHARRAAERIADGYVEFPPGFVTPEQADSAKEIYNMVIAEIATIIEAATAELKADKERLEHLIKTGNRITQRGDEWVCQDLLARYTEPSFKTPRAAIDAAVEIEELRDEWAWIEKIRPLIERQAIGQWRVCTAKGCYEADTLRAAIAAARNEQGCK